MSSSPAVVPEAPNSARTPDQVMVDYGHGLSNFDPYGEMAVLIAEVVRLRAALGAAVRRADAAEAETTRVNLAFAEWVNISTNEMTAERAAIRELHHRIEAPGMNAGFCYGCDYSWPCPTVALLDEGRAT